MVSSRFAKYDQFSVGDEDSDYTLFVLGYQSAYSYLSQDTLQDPSALGPKWCVVVY